jgi:glycosyltransferase involved in cell wall biosynthesis
MKILISAYSCEPGRGSEPGVGWNVVREIAKYHEVWVLTRPDESKEIIEAELDRNPIPNLHFVYFTLPFWQDSRCWGESGGMQTHYYLWQIQAYFVARRLHAQIGFDVIHHVTFVKYSSPSFLSLLPVPFVWGPVGGGESAPKPFWRDFSPKAKLYEILRNSARTLGELDPFVYMTAQKSAAIAATTEDTAQRLSRMGIKNIQILPAIGLTEAELNLLASYPLPDRSKIRFVSIGRLLHWKGFHLGLLAFAAANLADAEYWLLGEGAEQKNLQLLVEQLGIAKQVKFWGRLSREDTLSKLKECHVLVHPSLHDSGGLVCMEAMATSRPVICLDLGGPASQVTEETGFKIAAIDRDRTIGDIAEAMINLAKDSELRQRMGEAGRQLVREKHSWLSRGQQLAKLYEEIAKGDGILPDRTEEVQVSADLQEFF